jgi:hypothetical protein
MNPRGEEGLSEETGIPATWEMRGLWEGGDKEIRKLRMGPNLPNFWH